MLLCCSCLLEPLSRGIIVVPDLEWVMLLRCSLFDVFLERRRPGGLVSGKEDDDKLSKCWIEPTLELRSLESSGPSLVLDDFRYLDEKNAFITNDKYRYN